MQSVKAIIMIAAFSLSIMTAASPLTPNCIAKSKILLDVTGEFTLSALVEDDQGKFDLTKPRLVGNERFNTTGFSSLLQPQFGSLNRTVYSLKHKILITGNFKSEFLYEFYNPVHPYGLQLWGFDDNESNGSEQPWPARFTATKACDSYGRRFLRLGGPDGQDSFVVIPDRRDSPIYFKPLWSILQAGYFKNATVVLNPVNLTKTAWFEANGIIN